MSDTLTRRSLLQRAAVASPMLASAVSCTTSASSGKDWIFVGPYTRGTSKGIYRLSFDPQTGELSDPELAAETPSPSFLALHPSGRFLYAVNELPEFRGEKGGAVTAFAIDTATGALTELNAVSSKGGGPCHLMLTPDGSTLVVANYGGGSTASYKIGSDGKLSEAVGFVQHTGSGPNERRQKVPHAHGVAIRAQGSDLFAHVADLGIDRILHYRIADDAGISAWEAQPSVAVAPGAGPRHVITHPTSPLAFVINELDSTMTSFAIDTQTGVWIGADTFPTLPAGFEGETTTAELALHPNGRVLYGSNRGHDSLAVFAVDTDTGKLTLTGHASTEGKTPRSFAVHPSGRWLIAANQNTGNLTVFRVDASTGMPTYTGKQVRLDSPVCLVFSSSTKG